MRDHVVIAPDKFKGSLTAPEVAEHVAAGLGVPAVSLPVADGGDGTVDAVVACGFERVEVEVTGPTGERVAASYAIQGETAVIEMADASGLRRLSGGLASLTATSYGTGELIAHAVRGGARRIVLGLGGSACTDGGVGLAQALGARFLDEAGNDLPFGGGALRNLTRIDISGFMAGIREISGHEDEAGSGHHHASDAVAGLEFVVASDVDNPLLGPFGAAAVYGPQKGADPDQVKLLEAGLARLAAVAAHTHGLAGAIEHDGVVRSMGVAGQPGAGAAGGVGFAALAFLHAEIRPGIEYLLDLLDFDRHVQGARLVITGEGSLDDQSLRGKAPIGVANAAARHGVPVVAVCGRRTISDEALRKAGIDEAYALTDIEPDVQVCMTTPGPLLERLAVRIAATRLEDIGE
ncbi:glycerate kinase [Acrocarpospora pleiomorpha]|uniref:Glycerate kinase n=1 Tax=Acrocarpospora pleiomorpha TaxID=90975 RepID=A0A5M3XMJ7_9ACTN|nr:glycerate kinase [Acrocarpospora pleiomorpha]GES21976.1 glycerate kinase [Acrocarpospora pleiomorpha]